MIYDLSLSRKDFDQADRLVRSVVLQSGRSEPTCPNLVTSDPSLLQPDDQAYLRDNPESLGVCFGRDRIFDIWISPSYVLTGSSWYRDTLLHELCHGYIRVYKHNHRWKRFFGRVLHHYNSLVSPFDVEGFLTNTMYRYTVQGQDESYLKYVERVQQEQDEIAKIAVAEHDYVARLYTRISSKESST